MHSLLDFKGLFLNNRFILSLIVLNALVIFIQEFDNINNSFYYLDNVFTILFAIEAIIKINTYTFSKYWKDNWNRFDFILISLAILAILLESFNTQLGTSLSFVTSLRILRLFKSFRVIKFVPNIQSIIVGVNHAMKASYVIILAFVILLFICSILTCSLFKHVAPEYFDSPVLLYILYLGYFQ